MRPVSRNGLVVFAAFLLLRERAVARGVDADATSSCSSCTESLALRISLSSAVPLCKAAASAACLFAYDCRPPDPGVLFNLGVLFFTRVVPLPGVVPSEVRGEDRAGLEGVKRGMAAMMDCIVTRSSCAVTELELDA